MWDRVERLIGAEHMARLASARVGVVGVGSGGGFAALTLAMSGVGGFVLIDDDVIDETNVPRHVADRRYLGIPKAEAVAELIHQRSPSARVETRIGRFEDHRDALDGLDVLVVGVDEENAKYSINRECLARGLTAVYAGVYERGEGGDCVVIRPYQTPCYACWAAELREGLTSAKTAVGADLDYGMIGKGGTLAAEPALWLHVTRVASVQADLALNELLRGSQAAFVPPANTVILANRGIEIIEGVWTPPYGAEWIEIARDPACLVCGAGAALVDELSLDELMDEGGLRLDVDEQDEDAHA